MSNIGDSDVAGAMTIGDRRVLDHLKYLKDQHEDRIDRLTAECEYKTKMLDEANAKIPELEAEIARLRAQLSPDDRAAVDKAAAERAEIAALRQRVETLEAENETIKSAPPIVLATPPPVLLAPLSSGSASSARVPVISVDSNKPDGYIDMPLSTAAPGALRLGWLKKLGNSSGQRRKWKKYWVVVRDNYLFYYKSNKKDEKRCKFIRLNGCSVTMVPLDKYKLDFVFEIQTPRYLGEERSYYFYTPLEAEANDWVKLLTEYIVQLPVDNKYAESLASARPSPSPSPAPPATSSESVVESPSATAAAAPVTPARERTGTIKRMMSLSNMMSLSVSKSSTPRTPKASVVRLFSDVETKSFMVEEVAVEGAASPPEKFILEISLDHHLRQLSAGGTELKRWSFRWIRLVKITAHTIAFVGRDVDHSAEEQEWTFASEDPKQPRDYYFEVVNAWLERQDDRASSSGAIDLSSLSPRASTPPTTSAASASAAAAAAAAAPGEGEAL